jgi:hypothetical protein
VKLEGGRHLYHALFCSSVYGVATVSRIDTIIGLFCRIASLVQVCFAKKTYNLIDPTKCSHPILREHDTHFQSFGHGVATVSRIDKIIGLFCKRDL